MYILLGSVDRIFKSSGPQTLPLIQITGEMFQKSNTDARAHPRASVGPGACMYSKHPKVRCRCGEFMDHSLER